MDSKKITKVSIIGLFLVTIILSLVPVFQTLQKGEYKGVPPAYVDDDLYYYGRIKEVVDGKPFIGNPYFIEHRDANAAAFFVTDWLAAVPFLFGIPFSLAVVLNFVFWSLVFVFLAYLIGRAADISPPLSAGLALVAYLESYWMILRPVVMQEVFPFFLLFLLALFLWLRNPFRPRSIYFLIIACAVSFYLYAFLWQIIFTVMGVVFLHMVFQKKWPEVRTLLFIGLGTGLLALPILIYTLYQIHTPFYWETVGRVGLLKSYLPTMDAYHYGRWIVLVVVLYFFVQKWLRISFLNLVFYSGLGLIIMSVSNILTGTDIATGQHVGRFGTLWVALFFPMLIWKLWQQRLELQSLYWPKFGIILILLLLGVGFLVLNLKRSLPFLEIANADTGTIQEYAAPLNWLEQREKKSVVIWADDETSIYVPILTKHYVFWSHLGGLHLMSTQEVEDRFLASQFKLLTPDEVLLSFDNFEGAGVGRRYEDAVDKNKLNCLIKRICQPVPSLKEWIGIAKLESLVKRQKELKKNISVVIKQYHVTYLVADTTKGEDKYFKLLTGAKEVWQNERFIIYEI